MNSAIDKHDIDKIYQRIGEFAVSFQWIENLVRQIGWRICEPNIENWPLMILREESNSQLLDTVEKLYIDLIDKYNFEYGNERKQHFKLLIIKLNELRQYRNKLFHSAYQELKAGGEVMAILRSNQKVKKDKMTGECLFDDEVFSENSVTTEM